jgi:hypothetical protein
MFLAMILSPQIKQKGVGGQHLINFQPGFICSKKAGNHERLAAIMEEDSS